MLNGKIEEMRIGVSEKIADMIYLMEMNGGRGEIRNYLASQNISVPIGWRITDIGVDLSRRGKMQGYFLVVTKFI